MCAAWLRAAGVANTSKGCVSFQANESLAVFTVKATGIAGTGSGLGHLQDFSVSSGLTQLIAISLK